MKSLRPTTRTRAVLFAYWCIICDPQLTKKWNSLLERKVFLAKVSCIWFNRINLSLVWKTKIGLVPKNIYRYLMPACNTSVFSMYDIPPHYLSHQRQPVWSESQQERTCPSVDRCPLSNRCHSCNNYTFDHLTKSLLLRLHTCWLIHQCLPSNSFSFQHVTPTTPASPVQRQLLCTQTW